MPGSQAPPKLDDCLAFSEISSLVNPMLICILSTGPYKVQS